MVWGSSLGFLQPGSLFRGLNCQHGLSHLGHGLTHLEHSGQPAPALSPSGLVADVPGQVWEAGPESCLSLGSGTGAGSPLGFRWCISTL